MYVNNFSKGLLVCVSLVYVSQLIYKVFSKNKKRKEINEVIMFSQDKAELKNSKYSRSKITPNMERLLYRLNSPRQSLDICIYILTNADVTNAVSKLHYKGVKVRIIIDADMAYTSGSSIRKLEKQGIPVRWMKSTNLMHHKFCLIDTSTEDPGITPLLITGSLNWTNQALYGNWENVVVTSQQELVKLYKEEFERLWVMFTPIVDF